jgi:hypothetical protein
MIQQVINTHGLKFCTSPKSQDYNGFCCTGVLLDDFHLHHHPDLTKEEATERFDSVCKLLHEVMCEHDAAGPPHAWFGQSGS